MAAARKVSAAAITTRSPRSRARRASLAMEVVLPTPLTPTTRVTRVPGTRSAGRGASSSSRAISSTSISRRRSGIGSLVVLDVAADALDQLERSLHPDVGADQRLFEVVEGGGVEGGAPLDGGFDPLQQLGVGHQQAALELRPEALARLVVAEAPLGSQLEEVVGVGLGGHRSHDSREPQRRPDLAKCGIITFVLLNRDFAVLWEWMDDRAGERSRRPGRPSRPGDARAGGNDSVDRAIHRFQQGLRRDEAFRFLYETYFQAIQRFFARKGLTPDDCLDLTQETFVGIYKGLDGYEDRQRFAAWLYRVATTTYLKWRRSAATAKRAAVEVSRNGMENPEAIAAEPERQLDTLLDDERRGALHAAVADLPEQMRQCLTLRLYHQLAYQEIAVVMKLSIETVKAHLFRARKKLQQKLSRFALGDVEV